MFASRSQRFALRNRPDVAPLWAETWIKLASSTPRSQKPNFVADGSREATRSRASSSSTTKSMSACPCWGRGWPHSAQLGVTAISRSGYPDADRLTPTGLPVPFPGAYLPCGSQVPPVTAKGRPGRMQTWAGKAC